MGWYSHLAALERCNRISHDQADTHLAALAAACVAPEQREALALHVEALRRQSHRAADSFLLACCLDARHQETGGALLQDCLWAWYATLARDPRVEIDNQRQSLEVLRRLARGRAEDWPYSIDDPLRGRRAHLAALDQVDELLLHLDAEQGRPWDAVQPLVEQTEQRITTLLARSLEPLPLIEQCLLRLRYWLLGLDAERWRGWGTLYTVNAAPPGANFHRLWTNARATLARALPEEP